MTDITKISGKVTTLPQYAPDFRRSIDFVIKNKNGYHQIVSENRDIVDNRHLITGRVTVYGHNSSKTGDAVVMAERVELE